MSDNLDRLAGVSGPYTESFTYDVLGNITAKNGVGYGYTKPATLTLAMLCVTLKH
ncbi:MAG: hypothetical protein HYX90_02860 [Chloroflexi bacterium]|nr:hypothetical protein [Chloroflexota bacterium]